MYQSLNKFFSISTLSAFVTSEQYNAITTFVKTVVLFTRCLLITFDYQGWTLKLPPGRCFTPKASLSMYQTNKKYKNPSIFRADSDSKQTPNHKHCIYKHAESVKGGERHESHTMHLLPPPPKTPCCRRYLPHSLRFERDGSLA